MSQNYLDLQTPKRSLGKVDVNFSFLSLYLILFTFFIYLTSISTIEKQKAAQAIDSVNEKFKGKNLEETNPINTIPVGLEDGGDYDQEVKGLFHNLMPDAIFEKQGKGEIAEVIIPLTKIIARQEPPLLVTNASILFEKLAFMLKEKINNSPLELTILMGKTKPENRDTKDIIFYDEKNRILLLGQIARHFEKYGINTEHLSIGFHSNSDQNMRFQFRMAPQKAEKTKEIPE